MNCEDITAKYHCTYRLILSRNKRSLVLELKQVQQTMILGRYRNTYWLDHIHVPLRILIVLGS